MSKRTDLTDVLDDAETVYSVEGTGLGHEHVELPAFGLRVSCQWGGSLDDAGWLVSTADGDEIWETDDDSDIAGIVNAISDHLDRLMGA